LNYVITNKIKNIRHCEDTNHVTAIVRTGPRATHMVRAGTMLVTPELQTLVGIGTLFNSINLTAAFATENKQVHRNKP